MNTTKPVRDKAALSKFCKTEIIPRNNNSREEKHTETIQLPELEKLISDMKQKGHDRVTRFFFPNRARKYPRCGLIGEIAAYFTWSSASKPFPKAATAPVQ